MSSRAPEWASRLADALDPLSAEWGTVPSGQRWSAVVALLSSEEDPDLVFTLRSRNLAHHSGQISLPGGGREEGDQSPAHTALREAHEEIGLAPSAVRLLGQLRTREVVVSRNRVIPVVGLWSGRETIWNKDTVEVEEVIRWSVRELADPACRVTAYHPLGGKGPAWDMGDLFLWGFTAGVVDAVLRLGGWELPWDDTRVVEIPPRFRTGYSKLGDAFTRSSDPPPGRHREG